jgi:predicted metal-dependent phosphoesterase TrpH
MKEFRADLHCHSTCSDGTSSPEDLVKLAVDIGLSGFSITDHDSIEAYSRALPIAQQHGLEMISGAEFSTVQGKVSIHLLAYAFSLDNPIIHQFCQKHHERREKRNRDILKRLDVHGMQISEEEVFSASSHELSIAQRSIGRPHIALAMIKKGYVGSVNEAFKKYLGEGKPCYAPGESFTTEETLNIIHEVNGLAVIAHPHLIENGKTLQELLEMDFDGIECYYGRFHHDQNKRWVKIAEKKKWLITGGSDYHGEIKPDIPLGSSWVNEEAFRLLHNHYQKNLLS